MRNIRICGTRDGRTENIEVELDEIEFIEVGGRIIYSVKEDDNG